LEALERRGARAWENLESIFYVLYAGGDDLFIIGPWDAMIDLALELRRKYRAYTCENPEFGLSAGLIFIKPHVPIQQFSKMADEAERAAKNDVRNRLTIWGQVLEWEKCHQLISIGKKWAALAQRTEKPLPRGLLNDLPRLGKTQAGPMFTPTLYYALVRRLRNWTQEEQSEFASQVLQISADLEVPATYAIMLTRKE